MRKTHKAASKRILKLSKRGKLMRRNLSAQHLATNKSKRSRRDSTKNTSFSNADRKKIIKYL